MVEYICEKCFKKFDRKDSHNKHINRKYPCIPNKTLNLKDDKIEELEKQVSKLQDQMTQLLLDKCSKNSI